MLIMIKKNNIHILIFLRRAAVVSLPFCRRGPAQDCLRTLRGDGVVVVVGPRTTVSVALTIFARVSVCCRRSNCNMTNSCVSSSTTKSAVRRPRSAWPADRNEMRPTWWSNTVRTWPTVIPSWPVRVPNSSVTGPPSGFCTVSAGAHKQHSVNYRKYSYARFNYDGEEYLIIIIVPFLFLHALPPFKNGRKLVEKKIFGRVKNGS